MSSKAIGVFAATALCLCVVSAPAQIPDLSETVFWTVYEGTGTPCVVSSPAGNGRSFAEAVLPDETVVDATIIVEVRHTTGPVAHYPFEDIWLVPDNGQQFYCMGPLVADADTGPDGRTRWRDPLFALGWADEGVYVAINGDRMGGVDDMIRVVYRSTDLNGDGVVNLTDLGVLAGQLGGPGHGGADLNNDGRCNLTDLGYMFELGFGIGCPSP